MTAAARTFKGRGATVNPDGRYEAARHEAFDDGWGGDEAPSAPRAEVLRTEVLRTEVLRTEVLRTEVLRTEVLRTEVLRTEVLRTEVLRTEVLPEAARSIITRNTSPDIAFDRSINPYRGCEHGCVYCFARPNHAYVGLSPGLDFETRLFTKPDAARLLERELAAPGYRPATIALGTATDPYQPIERTHRLTRQVLEVLARARHPVGIVTKSNLVTRDIDILSDMAEIGLVKVAMSVTTLDPALARRMEPRAPHPERRLDAIRQLTAAGIPVLVMVAPIIPSLNDHDIEAILARARDCGAMEARHVLLRLPLELDDLVGDWLSAHYPGKKRHVMSLVRQARGGKAYDAAFGRRMTGAGPYAELIAERMRLARKRLGYRETRVPLRTDLFVRPSRDGAQLSLL